MFHSLTPVHIYWSSQPRVFWHLTHWCRVTHICVCKITIIGSDNGLSPGRRQAIIWTNAGIWSMGPLGTNFSEILIETHTFSFRKMHLKMSSGKRQPFCLGLNVLMSLCYYKCLYKFLLLSCKMVSGHQIYIQSHYHQRKFENLLSAWPHCSGHVITYPCWD